MTRKRTFSLPEELSDQIDALSGGNASAFVASAVRDKVARDAAAARLTEAYGAVDATAYAYWVQRLTARNATP